MIPHIKILQAGVPKSGNFWLYRIINSILGHAGLEQKSFILEDPIHKLAQTWDLSYREQCEIDVLDIGPLNCSYRISSIFRMPIDNIDSYLQKSSFVWTHSYFGNLSRLILPKFDKIIYIVRDPRDVAISMARFALTPYMQKYYPTKESDYNEYLERKLDGRIKNWVEHVGGYLQHRNSFKIYFIFYEKLLYSLENEINKLAEYLGVIANRDLIKVIKSDVCFSRMKKESPNHVRKGESGGWRKELTLKQKRVVTQVAGPMLKMLNYPIGVDPINAELPNLPSKISKIAVDNAIKHSRKKPLQKKLHAIYRIIFS